MEKIICYCKNISEETIIGAIKNGADSLDTIMAMTGACTGNACKTKNPSGKCCSSEIIKLLKSNDNKTEFSCCG